MRHTPAAPPHDRPTGFPVVPLCAALACFTLIIGAGALADLVPPGWTGNWQDQAVRAQAHVVDRFFPFDARWYQRIADQGYTWLPASPGVKQDVAFFPLWPLLLRLTAFCTASAAAARWATILLAAVCATASVCAFDRLARRLLAARDAAFATCLFALYPAASFLLLSYPTGLMNLLCILALTAMMDGRLWRAALCAGLVTAIGPLGLGTAMTVCVMAARRLTARGISPRPVLDTIGVCALSVSGLAAFVAWQALVLGDGLAFIKAQEAWAASLPWPARIPRAIVQLLVVPDIFSALHSLTGALRAPTLVGAQAALEQALNKAWLAVLLIGVGACLRLRCTPVLMQAAFTTALFIWFHSTSRPGNSTLRLTYCAIGVFLGLAVLLRNRPRLATCAIAASALLLAGGAFLVDAGYHVV